MPGGRLAEKGERRRQVQVSGACGPTLKRRSASSARASIRSSLRIEPPTPHELASRTVAPTCAVSAATGTIDPHKRISDQTIFSWRRQDRIDRGEQPRLTTKEKSELTTANKRTAELETELKIARRGRTVQGGSQPRRRYAAVEVIAAEDLPLQVACRVLGVSESGPRATLDATTLSAPFHSPATGPRGRPRHRHQSSRQVAIPAPACRRARDT